MRQYVIRWKSLEVTVSGEPNGPIDKVRTFNDVQWKDYGVRATDDQNGGYTLIIPYTSIYDIQVISEEIEL